MLGMPPEYLVTASDFPLKAGSKMAAKGRLLLP